MFSKKVKHRWEKIISQYKIKDIPQKHLKLQDESKCVHED